MQLQLLLLLLGQHLLSTTAAEGELGERVRDLTSNTTSY